MLPNSSMGVIRHERTLSVLIMVLAMHLGPVRDTFAQINPLSVGNATNVLGGRALGVVLSGNMAYVANGSDGLRVYDVSDPSNPLNVGHVNDGGFAGIVAGSRQFAFFAKPEKGPPLFAVSGPPQPHHNRPTQRHRH